MIEIVMIGSGGCMRELVWQILEDSKITNNWNVVGYVDNKQPENGKGLEVGGVHIPYLGNDDYLLKTKRDINVVLSIGNSKLRAEIANKYSQNPHLRFPNVILNSACVCEDLSIGQGCIITMDACVSTNVVMGDFVFMNTGSLICHDGMVGSYVTLGPRAQLAGAVIVGDNSEVGMNATIIQCLKIGCNVIVGAGATVIRNVDSDCTVVGVPARKVGH